MGVSILKLGWLACAVAARSVHKRAGTVSAPFTDSTVARYVGRVNPATNELSWPSAGVSFSFVGTSASIDISSQWGTTSVDIWIDGKDPIELLAVNGTSISTPTLAAGNHSVIVRKRSEGYMGSLYIKDITTDGTFTTNPVPTRQIEIIGDSISVGYGLDGVSPCTNTAAYEDNPKTYGALAADMLKADYNVIAWSGKGIIRNYDNDSVLLPELYTRYGANDADNSYTYPSSWSPEAIVIDLGTNDFSYLGTRDPINATAYTDSLVSFVQTLQTHYPRAHYFLVSSPMLSDTYPTAQDAQHTTMSTSEQTATAQLNSNSTVPMVHFVDWPTQGSDVGCDYHPDAATHAAEAKVLSEAIGQILHWT